MGNTGILLQKLQDIKPNREMAYHKKTIRILIGSDSKYTYWGQIGCSVGGQYGGYYNYIYGIKNIFAIQIYKGWGIFKELK